MKYRIVVASKDHTAKGVAGSFMQANHGEQCPLKRMAVNDSVVCHSQKQNYIGNEFCQAFTAIGQVADEYIYEHKMTEDFIHLIPWV